MAQAAEGQLLELADPLPGEIELLADFLERSRYSVIEAVAQRKNPAFAHGQPFYRLAQRVGDIEFLCDPHRICCVLVLDEVAELSSVLTNGLLE